MDIKQKLGARIKELRMKRGLTQEYIAEQINIQPANYSRIETGASYPKPENLEKICEILEVDARDLFSFEHMKDIETINKEIIGAVRKNSETARLLYKFLKTITD